MRLQDRRRRGTQRFLFAVLLVAPADRRGQIPQRSGCRAQAFLQVCGLTFRQLQRSDHLHTLGPSDISVSDLAALGSFAFIGPGKDGLPAFLIQTRQLLQRLLSDGRLVDPRVDQFRVVTGPRQRHEIIVLLGHQLGTRGQGGHLRITHVQQPLLPQLLADAADQGQIQRVIGTVAGHDVTGHELAGRLGGGRHQFQLRKIGTVIFAVAALHQAARNDRVIAIGSRTIQTYALIGDFIHFAGRSPEVSFQRRPIGVVQPAEDNTQAVVAKLGGTERLADECFQGMGVVACPVLHTDLPVIRLGQQKRQPHRRQPAIGQAAMQMVRTQMPLQGDRKI